MPKSGTYFFRPRKGGMSCPMNSRWLCSTPSGQRVRSEVESKLTLRYSRAYPKHSNQTINSPTIQMSAPKISEFMPMSVQSMRVIIASKRIAMDTSEIEEIIDIVRQHVL